MQQGGAPLAPRGDAGERDADGEGDAPGPPGASRDGPGPTHRHARESKMKDVRL